MAAIPHCLRAWFLLEAVATKRSPLANMQNLACKQGSKAYSPVAPIKKATLKMNCESLLLLSS